MPAELLAEPKALEGETIAPHKISIPSNPTLNGRHRFSGIQFVGGVAVTSNQAHIDYARGMRPSGWVVEPVETPAETENAE